MTYAVNVPASREHRAHLTMQLDRSLESLRAHDETTDVRVFVYGGAGGADGLPELGALAERHHAHLALKGSYEAALAKHAPPAQAKVLADYGVLHKWLALAELSQAPGDQVLYVDNDTFFFAPVSRLFEANVTSDLYAREEPFSSRSHAGYRPNYLDETKLFSLATSEGCAHLPPYNLGAVLLNHGMCERLAKVLPDLLSYLWRLCLGIVRDVAPQGFEGETQLETILRERARFDFGCALPYPSSNYWIVEQIGLLLALGRIPELTHDVFAREQVIQGVEYHHWPAEESLPVLAHYYSSNTDAFFRWEAARIR